MRFAVLAIALSALTSSAFAACPYGELVKRGVADPILAKRYLRGEGAPTPEEYEALKRGDDNLAPGGGASQPPLLDPISGIISPIGLGAILPRDAPPATQLANREVIEHVKRRLEERDEDVDIDAPILTPKAHKRHVEERGLLGGLLAPLTGPLQTLDLPTPQESGLKAIPGNDPNHQYQKPGPTDIRGDCPTLNTLANYGYLSRNGITTFAEAANAIQTAFSMSFDIAVFLSALGLLAGGDIPSGKYSIGGADPRVPNTLGPALGIDRHGVFEVDGSISRGDTFFGDNHSLNLTRWNALVNDANTYGDGLFTVDALKRNAAEKLQESRDTNPSFSFLPASGAVVYATRALLARPLPNGTAPNVPDYKNVAPFYLQEKFPKNWYRIPHTYSLVDLLADVASGLLFRPFPFGKNTGGRYVPTEINVPTEGSDLACFAFSALLDATPGQLVGAGATAASAVLTQILQPVFKGAGCDLAEYAAAGKSNSNVGPGGISSGDNGSGSGVPGQDLSKTTKPTGQSAGQSYQRR